MFTGPLPALLDHRKLARANHKLEGEIPASQFERFADMLESESSMVQLKLEFRKGKKQKTLIIGQATATVRLMCQKCLEEMDVELLVNFRHVVVMDEEELLELSDDVEGIVSREEKIRLVDIFEDELILNLPMVARHDDDECEPAFVHQNEESSTSSGTHKPFAALAELKNEPKRS